MFAIISCRQKITTGWGLPQDLLARKQVRIAVQWTFDHDSRPHFSVHLAMERRKVNGYTFDLDHIVGRGSPTDY